MISQSNVAIASVRTGEPVASVVHCPVANRSSCANPVSPAKADAIAFNLQGISELKAAFEAGQAGFQYAINARGGQSLKNVTNTELTTVLRDPALLAKTTFYDTRSKVIPTKDVLVRVGLS